MAQAKMKFGIDLGTTNSAICKMESGEPVIKKTDTLKDTLPSCVSFTKKKIAKVGDSAYNDLRQDKSRATKKWSNDRENVFIEFKRNMGTDKSYESSNMGETFSPEHGNSHPPEVPPPRFWTYTPPMPPPKAPLPQDIPYTHQNKMPQWH